MNPKSLFTLEQAIVLCPELAEINSDYQLIVYNPRTESPACYSEEEILPFFMKNIGNNCTLFTIDSVDKVLSQQVIDIYEVYLRLTPYLWQFLGRSLLSFPSRNLSADSDVVFCSNHEFWFDPCSNEETVID